MQHSNEARVSGRFVLSLLVAFFVAIAAVNVTMATLAIKTFRGLEADNPYKAGLEFSSEIAAAKLQQARNMDVELTTKRLISQEVQFGLVIRNVDPATKRQLSARLELRHPADKHRDITLTLRPEQGDVFLGVAKLQPGQWIARISLDAAGERIFRSVNRLTIE
ncbi:MAG: FixH family protein [Xanthobacteraceae bacterium]|nr:FixH family protein [Xanthobacteraceae bacterium]